MACLYNIEGDWFAPFNSDDFFSYIGWNPNPLVKIVRYAVNFRHFFEKDVLAIGHDHCGSPCNFTVITERYDWKSRYGDSGRFIGGAFQMREHPGIRDR